MKATHALTMVLLVPMLVTLGAQSSGKVRAPIFEVDPLWPKPLPNHWVLGMTRESAP
jgi:hypothetical protein